MKIGKRFNQLSISEYFRYIDHYKKYTDFNILGIYRSILENPKLDDAGKIAVRDYAHRQFRRTFEFLQVKDPHLYIRLNAIGHTLTAADESQLWKEVELAQQRILQEKKIKHRNFGVYSKHLCGYDNCPYNGLMIKQGTDTYAVTMQFHSDHDRHMKKFRSLERKKNRKQKRKFIAEQLEATGHLSTA